MKPKSVSAAVKNPRYSLAPFDLAFAGPDRGSARLVVTLLVAGTSLAVLVTLFCFGPSRKNTSGVSRLPSRLRGEPINLPPTIASSASNALPDPQLQSRAPKSESVRRSHPKPSSFQHRMVEFQVSQAEVSNSESIAGFGGTPAKIIFSPAQLAALSEPTLPPGFEKLGFGTLSGFPLEVTKEMAEGSLNLVAASSATRRKIPAAVQAWDNRLVAIRGFLLPIKMNEGLAIEFLLVRNQNMCCFRSVPKINEWICVEPAGEGVKPVMDQPIAIMGRLQVGEIRENGYLVGIYKIQAAQVYIHGAN